MKTEIINHIKSLSLSYSENELNDILIENKLALHFVDFFNEKEPLKRWQNYYDKGIRCVFIYPTYNIKIYKNIISYHFGRVQKIFARKCEIRIVKAKEIKDFFEQNNIEGYRNADKAYCLYYNDEPVMAYSVGHAFFGKGKYDLEIARGACKIGYQIIGGASKLWKHIIADNPLVQTIVYYVDRREYDGRSMKFLDNVDKTNFGGESFMNYWVKENRYANREPQRNAEIVKGYKDGSIIQVKNPGSWTNVYMVPATRLYVYKVTDKRTGKYYIGSKVTLNPDNYYIGYNYFTSSTDEDFVNDFRKNTTKYKHEVLKYFNNKQECLDYEADLIEEAWNNDRENLINRGFVRKSGKTRHVVSSNSPEVNEKRRLSMKGKNVGKKASPETIEKLRQAHLGKVQSEETKLKRAEAIKSFNKEHPEVRIEAAKKISETYNSKSEEEKKEISTKISKALKGRTCWCTGITLASGPLQQEIKTKGHHNNKPRPKETYTDEWKQKVSEQTKIKMAEQKAKDIEYIHSMGYITTEDLIASGWKDKQIRKLTPVGRYKKLKYFNKPE